MLRNLIRMFKVEKSEVNNLRGTTGVSGPQIMTTNKTRNARFS